MDKVYRQERKFLITLADFKKHSGMLNELMIQDPHNGANGYVIRSLYFDSVNDRDYEEKEEGIMLRRKIRLRNYDPKQKNAKLEMKQKEGSNQLKRSLTISREDAIELTKGNYSPLLKYDNPFAAECYGVMHMHCYRPKAVVQYNRQAYIAKENNIRITFDNNIIASESNFNIFDENLQLYPVFSKNNVVLEVKYNGFLLSYIRDFINAVDKSETSVSKYSLSRSVGKHYIFY